MKSILAAIAAALCLVSAVSAQAGECCPSPAECCQSPTASVEQRIRDIDIAIALKSYEQIQTECAKARLEITLVQTDVELSPTDRDNKLQLAVSRLKSLTDAANEIRARLRRLAKPVAVASK